MIFLINPICRLLIGVSFTGLLVWGAAILLAVFGLIKILWFD